MGDGWEPVDAEDPDFAALLAHRPGADPRFWIENATGWNLVDAEGRLHGQAVAIRSVSPA